MSLSDPSPASHGGTSTTSCITFIKFRQRASNLYIVQLGNDISSCLLYLLLLSPVSTLEPVVGLPKHLRNRRSVPLRDECFYSSGHKISHLYANLLGEKKTRETYKDGSSRPPLPSTPLDIVYHAIRSARMVQESAYISFPSRINMYCLIR